jgi:hypothetical protein
MRVAPVRSHTSCAEAEEHFRLALSIAEPAYPTGHPVTTGIRRNLDRLADGDGGPQRR